MKKILIFLIFLSIIFTFSCSKKNDDNGGSNTNDNTENTNNNENVDPVKDSLEVSCDYTEIYVNEVVPLTITATKKVSITSLDNEVVEILGSTLIGRKAGETTIKVNIPNTDLEKTLPIKVTDPILNIKEEYNLASSTKILEVKDLFETNLDNLDYQFDKAIASIENGKIIFNQDGLVKLTASYNRNNLKLSKEIYIISTDQDLITIASLVDLNVGDEIKLNPKTAYLNDDTYTITSSNPKVINIDNNILQVLDYGTSTITITSSILKIKLEQDVEVLYQWPENLKWDNIGIYLGVKDYGTVTNTSLDSFYFNFYENNSTSSYQLSKVGDYELHNLLEEGKIYSYQVSNNKITNLKKMDDYTPFSSVKTSYLVEGYATEVGNYQITINDTTYYYIEDYTSLQINNKAGGSTVNKTTIKEDDYVRLLLNTNGDVQAVYKIAKNDSYTPPVKATPGEKTISNLLKTALSAVGTALYIYGGNWDYQDVGSSNNARTIGISESWVRFFNEQTKNYNYKNTTKASSYYPFGAYNEYYYAGVDCSGYVGWVIYNVMNTENGKEGYVMSSTKMAKTFAEKGWGTYTRSYSAATLKAGDIVSISGHVWMCLGTCSDGSVVILHSTPSNSKTNQPGGGAQIGAIGSSTSCEAYKLAEQYNKQYYPNWADRYDVSLKDPSSYFSISNSNAGKFSWNLDQTGLTDPDDLRNKTASEILAILFK